MVNMKLRIAAWRLIWRFLVVILIIYVVALGFLSYFFLTIDQETNSIVFLPFGINQIIILVGMFVLGVIAFIPSLTSCYYVVEKKSFTMRRYWKIYEFSYANIEFIDIEESKRKKMVIFYASTCKTKYLLGDKKGILLETLIKKCPNTMSVEEFRRRHPEEKY